MLFDYMIYTYLTAIAFAFAVSLFAFVHTSPKHYKILSVLLGMTLLVEVLAQIVFPLLHIKSKYRNGLYNAFALIEFLFYAYFYYQISTKKWLKKAQLFFLLFYPVFWVLLVFDRGGLFAFHGSVIATGGFFIVCFALAYLYFLSDKVATKPIHKIPEFWISIGLVLFYCCQTPYMGSMLYLVEKHLELAQALLYLSLAINIIMYLLFGYALLCQKKNY